MMEIIRWFHEKRIQNLSDWLRNATNRKWETPRHVLVHRQRDKIPIINSFEKLIVSLEADQFLGTLWIKERNKESYYPNLNHKMNFKYVYEPSINQRSFINQFLSLGWFLIWINLSRFDLIFFLYVLTYTNVFKDFDKMNGTVLRWFWKEPIL